MDERSQLLWIPEFDENLIFEPDEISDLLSVFYDLDASDSEIEAANFINKSAEEFLEGEIELDNYTDRLAQFGINPSVHLQRASWIAANQGIL